MVNGMDNAEKRKFSEILRATLLTFSSPAPEVEVLRIWWAALNHLSLSDIEAAFGEYIRRGKHQPRPADILDIVDRIRPDGRPTADEAWAMVPRNESQSVIISDEIALAMRSSQPLLDVGDQVAARMAFRDAYSRAVEENRRANIVPRWFPSLGHDSHGRAKAVADAVMAKRITMDRAEKILPQDIDRVKKILGIDDRSGLLTDESGRERVRLLAARIGK